MNLTLNCSAAHQAYLPIVAASTRAATLHYCCNDRAFAWGPVDPRDTANTGSLSHAHPHDESNEGKELLPQVLLIDAGCEWDCYASDSKYLFYEVLPVPDIGADPVYLDLSMLSTLIPHFTFDYSHAHNTSWQWREVHRGSEEGVRACIEDAIRKFMFLRFRTPFMLRIPTMVCVGVVQDCYSWNALG